MNVFLIPGSKANFNATIRSTVDITLLDHHLDSDEVQRIIEATGDRNAIHCWAFKDGREKLYNVMNPGDLVLFKENKTGMLGILGEVCHKTHSSTLGKEIWPDQAAKPWEYIYFIKNIQNVNIDFSQFKRKLRYGSRFPCQGAILLNEAKWSIIRQQYGSFNEFLKSFNIVVAPKPDYGTIEEKPSDIPLKTVQKSTQLPIHFNKDILKALLKLDNQIEILKKDKEHKERAHESLVESLFEILGYSKFTDIKHRQGRIDISIEVEGIPFIVVEVKKDWNLSRHDMKVIRQAFNYALESGGRYVIITNGDYYAVYDQDRGRSYDDMFIGDFCVSKVPHINLEVLSVLQKKK